MKCRFIHLRDDGPFEEGLVRFRGDQSVELLDVLDELDLESVGLELAGIENGLDRRSSGPKGRGSWGAFRPSSRKTSE
jgi:hypothetical protein